ncbi:hypothetical protein COO60DRAFT_1473196 [Scenedesmus sp. NREL 46B-D3]|nr:hypothetical protein COO60DRAFT_1473196 [Scenedesmus sp. NREL 46B-D3]
MQHFLDVRRVAASQYSCNTQRRVVMRANAVTATRLAPFQLISGCTLWPSQHHVHHQLLAGSHCRVVACQAGPSPPTPIPAATQDFSPHLDSTVLGGQLLVLAITLGAAAYWWWSVVPSARRTLAKEKRSGPLNEYLVELQQNPGKGVERWFYTDWLQQLQRRQQLALQAAAKRAAGAAETSTATATGANAATTSTSAAPHMGQRQPATSSGITADGVPAGAELQQQQQQQQQQTPSEEPYVDKEPAFWSLDNPLLATAALLAAIGVVSTLLHGLS